MLPETPRRQGTEPPSAPTAPKTPKLRELGVDIDPNSRSFVGMGGGMGGGRGGGGGGGGGQRKRCMWTFNTMPRPKKVATVDEPP
jgi:hypothetical protein